MRRTTPRRQLSMMLLMNGKINLLPIAFLGAVFFLLPFGGFSQTEVLQIKIYGFEEGLSHRNVYKIQQDTYGFIWMTTVNGLNKYDGYTFDQVGNGSNALQLPEGFVTDMVIDHHNRIWLAQPDFIHCIDPNKGQVEEILVNQGTIQRGNEHTVNGLCVDEQGFAWSATYGERRGESFLEKYDRRGNRLLQIPLPGKYEHRPIRYWQDTLLVGAFENELWKFDLQGQLLDKYTFPFRGYEQKSARITALETDSQGRLYVLLRNGAIYYREKNTGRFEEHPANEIFLNKDQVYSAFLPEANGDLWIAGPGVLSYYNAKNGQVKDVNREVREISKYEMTYRQLFKDQSGVIWIASEFGAIKIVRSRELFASYMNGGNPYCSSGFCSMRGIAEDEKERVYFSYYNSIHFLDQPSNQLRPLFPNTEFVHSPFGMVIQDDFLYTGSGLRIHLPSRSIDTLLVPPEGAAEGVPLVAVDQTIWLGLGQQLYVLDKSSNQFRPFADSVGYLSKFPHTITFLHQGTRSGQLWIGTKEAGVFRLDLTTKIFEAFPTDEDRRARVSDPRILSIFEGDEGTLWLATANGLTAIDLITQGIRIFQESDGLSNNFVNGILPEGDSALWISTDNGLCRLHLETKKFTNFFKREGLPANEFNRLSFYQAKNGRLYFGGLNGIVAFFPSDEYVEKKEQQESRLLLTSFSKYDGELDSLIFDNRGFYAEDGIRLSYKDKFFNFGFALADYASPYQNLYSYKLEGYETDWSPPTTINVARYNNIPAGEYVFKVRATSKGSNWNASMLSVPVTIEQAYYKSPWFLVLCGLLFVSGVYGIMRYRIIQIRRRERLLEEQVRLRTKELQEEKKKSDDLLLNILPTETADELKATGSAKAKRYEQVTVMFADIKDFTHIAESLEPEELVAEIDFCFRAFDRIVERYRLEKIKTIGDAYLCVGGMPQEHPESACRVVQAALEIQAFLQEIEQARQVAGKPSIQLRIGIHTGAVVAGIVGFKKFAYDIWGDTVNIAQRMEAAAEPSRVNISQTTFSLVQHRFQCEYRGKVKAKNKGKIDMYYVLEAPGPSAQHQSSFGSSK